MPSQQLLRALGEALGSGSLVREMLGQSGSGLNTFVPLANGDGTDETAVINRAFTEAQIFGEGAVVMIPAGVYTVQDPSVASTTAPLFDLSGDGITVIGWGATLKIGSNGVGTVGGGGSCVLRVTGDRNTIVGLTIDCNSGVALATKDNSGFQINGTTASGYTGSDNQLTHCNVINGIKAEADITQGEECFVITNGLRNRLENCRAYDSAWQAFRTTGGHNHIVNCWAINHRGNGLRILDGEAVYVSGFRSVSSRNSGRHSILCDPGSSEDAVNPENDTDRRLDLLVIRDSYLYGGDDGSPDGSSNVLKLASVREAIVEGSYIVAENSSNVAVNLEDCVHQATFRNCFIFPNIYLRPVGASDVLSVFQGPLNGTVASVSLNLDVNGDGVADGAANYVKYTVTAHGLVKGKTIWVRGSSVTEYNGPQEVVAVTATEITTNRKYVSASIGAAAWAHSGCDRLNVIDCTFHNDQVAYNFAIENLNVPFANIERCKFKNLTEDAIKQGFINTEYVADYALQKLRIVDNKFHFRSTNICRAIRPTDATTLLTSGKTICYGNELFCDLTNATVFLVDTYDDADTLSTTYANRATLFNSDGDRLSCYLGTAAPTGADVAFLDGDRVRNTAPASGGAPGWVCTTAGSVGTWSAEANLA